MLTVLKKVPHLLEKEISEQKKKAQWEEFQQLIRKPQSFFARTSELNDIKRLKEIISHFSHKKQLIHIGIGGSCLGTKAIFKALAPKSNIIFREHIEDDIDELFSQIDIEDTLFHIVSKSGKTTEVIYQVKTIIEQLNKLGIQEQNYHNYFVLTSSQQDSPLYCFALKHQLEQLYIPKELGGRFSSLSSVSLFPCLFYSLDIEALLNGARKVDLDIKDNQNKIALDIIEFGETIFSLYQQGINQNVLMPYDTRLEDFTQWFAQLWAESLGKQTRNKHPHGITPIPSLGSRDQHSLLQLYLQGPLDKFVIFITNSNQGKQDKEKPSRIVMSALQQGCERAFEEVGRPIGKINIEIVNEYSLGQLFQFFHYTCVYLAVHMQINPYDQPAVEIAKRHTESILKYDLSL